MAEADSSGSGQCRAKTSGGDRCQREAREDGFCYQHGPDDETVEDAEVSADGGESEEGGENDSESSGDADAGGGSVGIREVRGSVEEVAPDLIGHPFDGVVEIQREDEGWYAVVEVVERSAVPDTQDILGRYAVELDEGANVESYRLIERFKRGDVSSSIE